MAATASHVDSVQQGFVGARSSARPEARVSRLEPGPELVFASAFDLDAMGLDRSMRCSNLIVTDCFSIELEDGSRVSDYRAQSIVEALGVLRRTQPGETSRVSIWLVLDDEQFRVGSELQTRVLGFDSETQLVLDVNVSRNRVGYGVTVQGVC